MRIGVTLQKIREEVQLHAGLSTKAGHGLQSRDRINLAINTQESVWASKENWPTMSLEVEAAIPADAQFISIPSTIDYDGISEVWAAYGDQWLPVFQGIGREERSSYGPSDRGSYPHRYELRSNFLDQIEVWPICSDAQTLRFTGRRAFGRMEKDSDVCSIDADVLAMRAAAFILARDKKDDAAALLEQANGHANTLLKNMMKTSGSINLGSRSARTEQPGIDYIPAGS